MKKKTSHPISEDKKSKRTGKEESTPERDPSKSNAGSRKTKEDNYPGYPPYPPTEDIFNNKEEKLPLDDEGIILGKKNPSSKSTKNKALNSEPIEKSLERDEEEDKPVTDADVTPEEIALLDSGNLNTDGGDDEQLRKRVTPVDMSGDDLDIPGAELDDADEAIGEEDEENNPYSIGGDRHEDLEEDPV